MTANNYLPAACLFIAAALSSSCGTAKRMPPSVIRDSVRVEYRERIVRDTVRYDVPPETERIVTRDTSSRLENSLAVSEAVVSGGFLTHSLRTKPQKIAVPVEIPVSDTLVIYRQERIDPEIVEVEKELTLRQRAALATWWWLLLLAVVGWRRELAGLVRKLVA